MGHLEGDTARGAKTFRCGLGGYDKGLSSPWPGFESRHRNKEGDTAQGANNGVSTFLVCVAQLVSSARLLNERSQVRALPRTLDTAQGANTHYITSWGSSDGRAWPLHGQGRGIDARPQHEGTMFSWSYGEVVSFLLWEQESRVRFPMRLITRLLTATNHINIFV